MAAGPSHHRTIAMVGSPLPTSQHLTLVVTRLFFLEPVSLGAKSLDEHSLEQYLGGSR
jgi:hypothetical protein